MSIIDRSISFLKTAMSSTGDTIQNWSQEWANAVENFKTKAKQFVDSFELLKSKRALAGGDPELKKEYDSLMNKGQWIYNTIQTVARQIDFIGNNSAMGSLGVLPLIPVAVIAGAVAAMTAWLADAYIITQKLRTAETLSEKGHDPVAFAEAFNDSAALINIKGAPIQGLLLFGGIGLGLYFLWPQIKEALD